MTHRDPEVQYTARTMLYRMLSLMGKATRSSLDEVNVMTVDDVVRLAGANPNEVQGYGVFMDFRGPEFQHLRSGLRRIAIGLTKGGSTPYDVMHEIGHVVSRAVLDDADRARIYDLYQSASDDLKTQMSKAYRKAYAHMDLSANELEHAIAEEWFAEGLSRYMGERVSKKDAFKVLDEGDLSTIELRGGFDSMVDKAVEFVAYITNGLIGRNDIKQEFRRLTLFGDMFDARRNAPIRNAYAGRNGVPASVAADYAEETLRNAPKRKIDRIMNHVRGAGRDAEGRPVVWYHGTPNGKALRKDTAPDAILQPSPSGFNGRGIYLTAAPRVASHTYANNATADALKKIASSRGIEDPEVEGLAEALTWVRNNLGQKRREYAEMQEYYNHPWDKTDAFTKQRDFEKKMDEIEYQASLEAAMVDELAALGVETDPYVIPAYVRVENAANFTPEAVYFPGDPFIEAYIAKAQEVGVLEEYGAAAIRSRVNDNGMSGDQLFSILQHHSSETFQGGEYGTNPNAVTDVLEAMGYDGLRTKHTNQVADRDVIGEEIAHDVLVVFNSKNVKHVDADLFDADDARLYYRDVEGAALRPSGPLLRHLAQGRALDEISPAQIAEGLELGGMSAPVIDAVTGIFKGKTMTPRDEQAIRKVSLFSSVMRAQSHKMREVGMNWVADWYQPHFADIQQTFMKKWTPIEKVLRQLPDNDSKGRRWLRRSTADSAYLGMGQPKSHRRIVSALRRGDDSRLEPKERAAFQAVREMFAKEHKAMRDAGIFVGHRQNYFPQVWNQNAIRKNEGEFLQDMADYFVMENAANGKDVTPQEANIFARKIFMKLSNDGEDTIHFPVDAVSSASPGDAIDFNRLIELDKYPGMIDRMEKYLEGNLEAIVNRYLDASTRRTKMTQQHGINGQGVKDYMMVMQEGEDGIARLLSTNRVIEKDIWHRNLTGEMEEIVLRDVTRMPFENEDPQLARDFAKELVEVRQQKGEAAARRMLEDIGPRTRDDTIPQAYARRVDAILGALQDYKGQPANVASQDYDMLLNAMRAANKRPLADSQFGGMAMVHATRALRNFNAITLLSFTTLTSLTDLVLPAIRSGNLGAWAKGLSHMARDPEYAELIRATGVAIENQLHEHLSGLHGGFTSKTANAFFNATLLTPYTEMTRRMAGATGHESFKSMQRQAFRHYKEGLPSQQQPEKYKIAHRYMHKYGLGDFLPDGKKSAVSLSDNMLLKDDEAVRASVIRFANESIFLPNADDIPMWAQTPIGATIFQLKSYPLMLGRLGKEVLMDDLNQFFRTGETQYLKRPALFLSMGPAFGMGTLAIKDIVQMRGGEENRSPELRKRNILQSLGYDKDVHGGEDDFLGWYFEGMVMMGGFGLLLELMHDVTTQVDNGAWGKVRVASTVGGPAVGTAFSTLDVLAGVMDAGFGSTPDSNAKERTGVREAVRRIPVIGQTAAVREAIVDGSVGEAQSRGGGGGGNFGGGFGGGFGNGF
jgi:hypothetical protein